MLTALVVAADGTDRARTAALLAAAGWRIREADDLRSALAVARAAELDLVVADLDLPGGDGPALLRRLRLIGCRAHLLGTSRGLTAEVREAGSAAGALAVLPAPVDAGVLLRFLLDRVTGTAVDALHGAADDVVDGELSGRLQSLYAGALPGRLSAIADGARSGDAPALASASTTLAGTSAQLGHPEVAELCRAIAADARRGVLAHELVDRLLDLATG
ncbi:response regulator [Blastococcus sp. TF02A-26]|uniref:response regulator n=1 Tax=Blastococcus sp. TF02A-26 TaxID=2250577 RepID=UPI000DE92D74|nr:response regulator [Blastococcus sp. TF02A-26]